jgi:hypothetical protein
MHDHAGFGWVLVALGLVIPRAGLVWNLAPSIPRPGRLQGDSRLDRERETVQGHAASPSRRHSG